ncbi:MAG: glycosyltransferase [Anaerolineales bacterium]|nr:glycosyltransferase [Anaerolineales bacterium]
MRIACISASSVPSRTANSIQMMKVCQALVGLGHEVQVWLPGQSIDLSWDALAEHYGLRDAFRIKWLRFFRPLRRYDFCFRAVVAALFWGADLYYIWPLQAAALASTLGLPTVLEMHDQPHGRFGPLLFKRFLRGSGALRLLPTTGALRVYLSQAYRVPLEEPFAVISPNGVDLERYQDLPTTQAARQALGLPEAITFGYTGHLYPGRGVELLLELARINPSVQFLWVGGEPAAIQRWRTRLQDATVENVRLLGFVSNENLPMIHAACDVLLMPYARRISVSSGGDTARFANPMKVFEYLAAGRVIISSDLPVLREVLDESNAILAPPEDLHAWDEAIKALASDPQRREMLASQAARDAEKYTWRQRAQNALRGIEV